MALATLRPRVGSLDAKIRTPPKTVVPFYTSPEWRAFIGQVIRERGRICEDKTCKAEHHLGMRVFGDHIVELQDGGAALDRSNVQLLCGSAHTRKTNEARRRRSIGMGVYNHPRPFAV